MFSAWILASIALFQDAAPASKELAPADMAAAGRVAGLEFSAKELEQMEGNVLAQLEGYRRLWQHSVPNSLEPAFTFDPLDFVAAPRPRAFERVPFALPEAARPANLEALAFADVPTLAALIKSRRVSCVELARSTIARVKRLDEKLHAVVGFTEERALAQAQKLDAELAEGHWRGPLHGVPFGAKDLFAARGARTTWGSSIHAEQVIDQDATVVARLEAAGAVLVCKTSLGEFAYGDLWFGGRTRNPWNPEEGSSGSSAGSASLVAAGGLPFALGTETLGSIVSPCTRCGATGIRPSFGRVPRTGAMNLCWTMDKVGPIARSVFDAALVLEAIAGPDGRDGSVRAGTFKAASARDVRGWKVGYVKASFERNAEDAHVLDELRGLGVELVPFELPAGVQAGDLLTILTAEAATAFDELTRDGRDEKMVWQDAEAWPNTFRAARLIPAVEYLRASRLRTQLLRDMEAALGEVVAWVHPSFGDAGLVISNLTGHPCVVMPSGGVKKEGGPRSITFGGRIDREEELVALAGAWQVKTGFQLARPR